MGASKKMTDAEVNAYWADRRSSGDFIRDTFFKRFVPRCGFCGDYNHLMDTCAKYAKVEAFRASIGKAR